MYESTRTGSGGLHSIVEPESVLVVPGDRDVVLLHQRDTAGINLGRIRYEMLPTPSFPSDHVPLGCIFAIQSPTNLSAQPSVHPIDFYTNKRTLSTGESIHFVLKHPHLCEASTEFFDILFPVGIHAQGLVVPSESASVPLTSQELDQMKGNQDVMTLYVEAFQVFAPVLCGVSVSLRKGELSDICKSQKVKMLEGNPRLRGRVKRLLVSLKDMGLCDWAVGFERFLNLQDG
eukprot:PhF_6_TR7928/c0_g1_i1/m.11873